MVGIFVLSGSTIYTYYTLKKEDSSRQKGGGKEEKKIYKTGTMHSFGVDPCHGIHAGNIL